MVDQILHTSAPLDQPEYISRKVTGRNDLVVEEQKPLKIKHHGEVITVREIDATEREDLRKAAAYINSIEDTDEMTAREQIDYLIEEYTKKKDSYRDQGDHADPEKMTRDVYLLLMLGLRKDGRLAQELQEVAELNIFIHRDKGLALHQDKTKVIMAGAGFLITVTASAISAHALVTAWDNAKKVVQIGQMAIQGANGLKSIEGLHDTRTQGQIAYVNANQQSASQKENAHRDDGRQALNMQQSVIQKIQQLMQSRSQVMISLFRNN